MDTHPPVGAGLTTTVVRRHVILQLQHHDRASLLAGKLHALLQRPYTKGRDVYDLLWYLSDPEWPAPNLTLLNNALQQTGWELGTLTEANWRRTVQSRLQLYDEPPCDPDNPVSDPWEVLAYAQDGLGALLWTIILGLLILAQGFLQIPLGLSAGRWQSGCAG